MKYLKIILLIIIALSAVGLACDDYDRDDYGYERDGEPADNDSNEAADADKKVFGFWFGLWHGFIAWFMLIRSFFVDESIIYHVTNNGTWYNLGFLVGVSVLGGGCGSGSCRKKMLRKTAF